MRRTLASALVAVLVAVAVAVSMVPVGTGTAAAAAADQYSWRNIQIAGGGYVPGIIFNQTQPNLIYARTDIGGAYRWNQSTGRWVRLLDWVGWGNWGWNGVVSLATDPVDPNRVYVAAGMYTNSWDPNNRPILRSSVISAGGAASFGFQACLSGSNAKPASFRLNGTTCTVA